MSPYRIFIIDDSGSMAQDDGRTLIKTSRETYLFQTCSRWHELTNLAKFHLGLVQTSGVRADFRLLNGLPSMSFGNGNGTVIEDQMRGQLLQAFGRSPQGGTPLCGQIVQAISCIQPMAEQMRLRGERAVIIIETDGEPTDGDLVSAMAPLATMPVSVVVRLCTDDANIVKFWNNVDQALEVPLDVLDDLTSEAHEVHAKNPWLTYNEHIHNLRILGIPSPEFDMLDEELLTPDQLRNFISIISGSILPYPTEDWTRFELAVRQAMAKFPPVLDPRNMKMRPWIRIDKLAKCYRNRQCLGLGLGLLRK
jgi:hypothetical protein